MQITRRKLLFAGGAAAAFTAGMYPVLKLNAQGVAPMTSTGMKTLADKRPTLHADGIRFGAYDPHGDFTAQTGVASEHLFLPWEDVDLDSLALADAYALERKRNVLITVEPWSWDVNWRLTSDELRRKVMRGDYDQNMQAIAARMSAMKSPLILRWGQEMEDTSGRFSWSGWNPRDYITAYKRMVDMTRKAVPSVKVMWSPKGLDGLQAYYPGDSYADLVGLSVFGLEEYDKIEYGGPKTFTDLLRKGYGLVETFNKPVWVAELGYEGGDSYVRPWMNDVTLKQADFPKLEEVVYFNDKDVHAWPHNLGRPDWRVVRPAKA
ncbi:glycoside hydrolase family 26 protein [Agrobacterium sp. M50-1]|uniref:glycoside hydrolase family 26 protein n=1 Tax=Agrobacterium sp. M50-1 TaxID=3132821 RepID=UPI003CE54530